jgi:hypothetical protein
MPIVLLGIGAALLGLFAWSASKGSKITPLGPPPAPLTGPSNLTDAQLATIVAAANVGNQNAMTVLAALNVSPNPAVQDQLKRVLSSMMSTPAASAGWGPQG